MSIISFNFKKIGVNRGSSPVGEPYINIDTRFTHAAGWMIEVLIKLAKSKPIWIIGVLRIPLHLLSMTLPSVF